MKKGPKMKHIYKIIFVSALVVFVISGWKVYSIQKEYQAGNEEYQELSSYVRAAVVPQQEKEQPDEEKEEEEQVLLIDFVQLKEKNPDLVGWIYAGNFGISYPVVKGTDNEYYLHRTFEGQYNGSGCIFADYTASGSFDDYNTFLYGHNMKNGTMFGSLKKLLREDGLYDDDPYFYIYTEDYIYKYIIYSYYITPPDSDSYNPVETKEEYGDYLGRVLKKSSYDCGVKPEGDAPTVSLSTCSGSGENKQRFVVHGVMTEKVKQKEQTQ